MRSILGADSNVGSTVGLTGGRSRVTMSKADLDRRLRARRSSAYLQAMASLDAGGHVCDPARNQQLLDAIREELPEVALEQLPIGVVARCYLGNPYEVHILSLQDHAIVEHYKAGSALPGSLERARGLALHPAYVFVEVYADSLRAVSSDGTVAVVGGA